MALFGVVPAMVLMNKGVGAKLTAASNKNGMRILANDEFATLWEEEGKDAFTTWEQQKGRKFTFGTLPSGTVPDIMLRYWLREAGGVDPESAVSIEGIGGHGKVKQALLAGRVDGTSITEPVATVVLTSDAPYAEIGWSGDYMPGQPTTAVVMGQSLREEYPSVATAYLEAHERATQFIADNPMRAAAHASTVIGEESLPPETARSAIQSPASQFVVDPHSIAEGAVAISEYAAQLGKIDAGLSEGDLFDYSLYDGES
jgi:NitT/TauT family transport system substrate-binding protein